MQILPSHIPSNEGTMMSQYGHASTTDTNWVMVSSMQLLKMIPRSSRCTACHLAYCGSTFRI